MRWQVFASIFIAALIVAALLVAIGWVKDNEQIAAVVVIVCALAVVTGIVATAVYWFLFGHAERDYEGDASPGMFHDRQCAKCQWWYRVHRG